MKNPPINRGSVNLADKIPEITLSIPFLRGQHCAKAMNSSFTSLSLKLIGVIFLLSFLLDLITLAISPNWLSPQELVAAQFKVGFITNIVERGVVPLVGTAFILVGYWIDSSSGSPKSSDLNLKLPTFILASLLGLIFLLFIPLYLMSISTVHTNNVERIEREANQGKSQIQQFLGQIDSLSKNPQLLDQAIQQRTQVLEQGQVQGQALNPQQQDLLRQQRQQLVQLRDLSKKPEDFKKRIKEIKTQLETRLREQVSQVTQQANTEIIKQSLRTGLSSLMLTIVYSTVGWLGLRSMGAKR